MSRAVVCDLDGVVYRGDAPTRDAGSALRRLDDAGYRLLFATNNSARPPSHVRDKLETVTGYVAVEDQIVTSSVVAASLIVDGPVLIVGEEGVLEAVIGAGFDVTTEPGEAKTVVVGLDRRLTYEKVARAADAVRAGAALVVTNRDPTYPVEDGLLPGAGACAAAVETAAGVVGVSAGKPSAAMREMIERRLGEGPIWMIGDRPDTDLALASGSRWRTVLVLTGVTSDPSGVAPAPDQVTADLAEAVETILTLDGADGS